MNDRNEEHTLSDLKAPAFIMALLYVATYLIDDQFNITAEVETVVMQLLKSLIYMAQSWLIFGIIIWVGERLSAVQSVGKRAIDASFIRTLFRLIAIIGAGTVIYFGAQSMGIPVAPLLAGFGALGLAVGIGAQEYFKNVVGGLTLFLDRPVRVGEKCEFGTIRGRIESIGLRSTQIRAADKTLLIVPNSHFSTVNILNSSRKSKHVFKTTVSLGYGTSHAQICLILSEIKSYLTHLEWVVKSEVTLESLTTSAINIAISADTNIDPTHSIAVFLETTLLRIIEIVETAGAQFATATSH